MLHNNIKVIKREDKEFPWFLYHMEDGPEALYFIGDISLLSKRSAAVVGARKCSEYGRQVALRIGELLAVNDVVTVSGLAAGIDSFAHRGAIQAGGETVAVLGCGPDVCYPRANRRIYDEICQKGLVISEYPPGTEPRKWHFPRRNKIIAALSEVLAVVEAGQKSGALITASAAAEQGKEVMAVPGNISSVFSMGSNNLIADGAGIMTKPEDILYSMGIVPKIDGQTDSGMGEDEKKLYEVLEQKGEATIDYLCGVLRQDAFTVSGLVTIMEMKGVISYQSGKIFIAKF